MKDAEAIRRDVLDELSWDLSLDTAGIGVAVHDGAVTLTGHVRSYAEKRAADKAAKRIEGVVAVANDLEVRLPTTSQRDDSDIAQAVAATLQWNVSVPDDVTATVDHGWVTLEGTADRSFQRRAAEAAVRDLIGVRGVSNLIHLKTRALPGDVKAHISKAFQRSAQIDADHVEVTVADGTVTLTGSVRSWSERQEAEHAARAAAGVSQVDNRLRISSYATTTVL